MGYLKNISRFSNADNLGGILTLQVFIAADIESIGAPVDGMIYGDIVMKAGKSSVTWSATLESSQLQSKSRTSREGNDKGNLIEFLIPKDRPAIKHMLALAEEDEFVVLYLDSNGQHILLGTPEMPARFVFDHDSGNALGSLNAYSCRFYFDGPDNRYHYNGSIPQPVPGAAPCIVKFNGTPIASLQPGEDINILSEFGFTEFFIIP